LTDTICKALIERLEREKLRRGHPERLAARCREIGEHCAALQDCVALRKSLGATKPACGPDGRRHLGPDFRQTDLRSA
jgi:hypothetical protein